MDDQELKKYINIDNGLKRVGGNKVLYKKLLGMFTKSPQFDDLEAALAAKDFTKAADEAHAIKGISGNLDMPTLFKESTDLMNQLRAGAADETTLANYRSALEATRKTLDEVIVKLG
jgi:HPt (histidine-containing phosphotransfer) domain-containing protein